jgi:hypothetical protein
MANMMLTMGKALLKHKLHLGTMTGMERFKVSAVTLADRASTFLAATNIEPTPMDHSARLKFFCREFAHQDK